MEARCIRCGEAGTVRVDVTDGDTLHCLDCDATYSVSDVRDLIASWGELLKWLDAHPARRPEPATA